MCFRSYANSCPPVNMNLKLDSFEDNSGMTQNIWKLWKGGDWTPISSRNAQQFSGYCIVRFMLIDNLSKLFNAAELDQQKIWPWIAHKGHPKDPPKNTCILQAELSLFWLRFIKVYRNPKLWEPDGRPLDPPGRLWSTLRVSHKNILMSLFSLHDQNLRRLRLTFTKEFIESFEVIACMFQMFSCLPFQEAARLHREGWSSPSLAGLTGLHQSHSQQLPSATPIGRPPGGGDPLYPPYCSAESSRESSLDPTRLAHYPNLFGHLYRK